MAVWLMFLLIVQLLLTTQTDLIFCIQIAIMIQAHTKKVFENTSLQKKVFKMQRVQS